MDGNLAQPNRTQASAALAAAVLALLAPQWRVAPVVPERGTLRLVGSRAMRGPVQVWTGLFRQLYPRQPIRAAMFGSGLGAGAMADDRADVVPITRPLEPGERRLLDGQPAPVRVAVGAEPRDAGDFYLYLARDPRGRPRPGAIAFARVALSPEGQAGLVASGYAPLPEERRIAALSQIARLASTT